MSDDANNMIDGACLSEADGAALDALVAAGFRLDAIESRGAEDLGARAARLSALLSSLGAPVASERAGGGLSDLVDITLARVSRAGGESRAELMSDMMAELHPEDGEALDSFVTAGFRLSRVPAALRERAGRIDAIGRLVSMPVRAGSGSSGSLIDQTMARVGRTLRPAADAPVSRSSGFRMADLLSVAALLALAAGLLFPVASAVRSSSSMASCGANFGLLASALTRYANDFRGEMPLTAVARTGAGSTWWNVGRRGESNSANLYTLARGRYSSLDQMACAGNRDAVYGRCDGAAEDWPTLDAVSYSYHVMFGAERPRWDTANPGMVVLADRSPVVRRAIAHETIFPLENSRNHGGRGQTVLRADGSAAWMASPMNGTDNIWLPTVVEAGLREGARQLNGRAGYVVVRLNGNEMPRAGDSLLGP